MTHRSERSRRRLAAVALVAALLPLAGCFSLPTSGPVVDTTTVGSRTQADPMTINPRGPQKGDPPAAIVKGFLDAMRATPIVPTVPREFLSADVRDSWVPTQTITYDTHSAPRGSDPVTVSLTGADLLDGRGAWEGALRSATGDQYDVTFTLVREDGQWRIKDPPTALIVPESWFEERFRQVSLFFFDPTGSVLVPDPVFVPQGRQLASSLVAGLTAGPSQELADYMLNAVPAGLRAAVAVPVSDTGVAQVKLTGSADDTLPPPAQAALLVAQLAWTLRQDPEVERFEVTIGDQPLEVGGQTQFPVEAGDKYAPYVDGSSTLLYGLVDGRMVGGSAQNLDPVAGPFGSSDYSLRSAVPDLRADHAAGVSADGTSLLVAALKAGADVEKPIAGADDLLDPAWDFSDRIWTIDRRPTGAVVRYIQAGYVHALRINGITGQDVKAFLVSRDGSRLVAVIRHGRADDGLVVSRILVSPQGRVLRALDATPVTEEDASPGQAIRAIAWRSPTSIVVLHPQRPSLFQIRTATVDGAPTGVDAITSTISGDFTSLAGTPSPDQSIYAVAKGHLLDLAGLRVGSFDIDPAVVGLTYPG